MPFGRMAGFGSGCLEAAMLKRIEKVCVDIATLAIMLLAILIFTDVVALNIFNRSVPDVIIIIRELMVLAIVMPLAAATANRAHISVEIFANAIPERIASWFVLFGSILGLLALTPILYSGGREFLHQWSNDSVFYGDLNLPRWPGRLAFLLGIALAWVRLWTMVFNDLRTLLMGGVIRGSST